MPQTVPPDDSPQAAGRPASTIVPVRRPGRRCSSCSRYGERSSGRMSGGGVGIVAPCAAPGNPPSATARLASDAGFPYRCGSLILAERVTPDHRAVVAYGHPPGGRAQSGRSPGHPGACGPTVPRLGERPGPRAVPGATTWPDALPCPAHRPRRTPRSRPASTVRPTPASVPLRRSSARRGTGRHRGGRPLPGNG